MIKIFGIIYTLMWISQVPYLFPHPFQEHEGIRNLAKDAAQFPDWLKQESVVKDKSADELEKTMLTELRINWIKSALLIIMGILSGCLLFQRRKAGYFLTFFLSILVIGIRFLHLVRYRSSTFSLEFYSFLLHRKPVQTIHDFLMQFVLLGMVIFLTYIFLTRKSDHFVNEIHNIGVN